MSSFVGVFMPAASMGERISYLLLSHAFAALLHIQICLSHFAEETYEGLPYGNDKVDWFRTQLRTTMNISCPPWLDWFHGGLQFQVEHHLYPRIPRRHLRRASQIIQPFCEKHGVEYKTMPWIPAQVRLVQHMKSVAAMAQQQSVTVNDLKETTLWHGLFAMG